MNEQWLKPEECVALLRLARETIAAALQGEPPPQPPSEAERPGLWLPLAVFVTLRLRGELRGCIGEMAWDRPLSKNVVRAAVASAFHDPRFWPLTEEELPEVQVEISVLSPLQTIARPEDYEPLAHGIVIEVGERRAVFLPQVARQYGWPREEMLTQLSLKAGLPPDAWRDARAVLKIFTIQEFSEETRKT
jgi:AmmeMemoRadiSam system protein A